MSPSISKILRPEYSSKIVGVIFIILSSYLFLFTRYTNASIGALFIGLLSIFIIHLPTVEKDTAVAGLKSGYPTIHHLLEDLEVSKYGVFIPTKKNLTEPRVYIPAGDTLTDLPDLYDEMCIVSGGRGKTGISLVPPGKPLLDEAKDEMEYEIEGEGITAGRESMAHLTQGMGLAKSFSFREEKGKVKIRITLGSYDDFCEEMKEETQDLCTRTGCPICGAFLTAASECLGCPLKIVDFEKEDKHVKYTLKRL